MIVAIKGMIVYRVTACLPAHWTAWVTLSSPIHVVTAYMNVSRTRSSGMIPVAMSTKLFADALNRPMK